MHDRLSKSLYCSLATTNNDGSAWSTPLLFAFDKNTLYWSSPLQAIHSQNILRDGRVFVTVFDTHTVVGEGIGDALYMRCIAGLVMEDGYDRVIPLLNERIRNPNFYVSRVYLTGSSPLRLFQARINRAWIDSGEKQNGVFVDTREEIPID